MVESLPTTRMGRVGRVPARRAGSRLRGPVTRARPRRERTPLRRSSPRGVQKGRHPGTFLGGDRSDTQLFPSLQTLFCGTGEARAALALAYGPVGLVCHNTWWGWRQSLWPPRHWCLGGGGEYIGGEGGRPRREKPDTMLVLDLLGCSAVTLRANRWL